MTIEEAKKLNKGQYIYHKILKYKDGRARRWKVNGEVKLWKRDTNRIKIPLKYGLYDHNYLTEKNVDLFSLAQPMKKAIVTFLIKTDSNNSRQVDRMLQEMSYQFSEGENSIVKILDHEIQDWQIEDD